MKTRIIVPIALLLFTAGCTATPQPAFTPTAKPITTTLTCQQFGQAAAVLTNAVLGNANGSVTDEKLQSELERGRSMLAEIEVEPGTELERLVEGFHQLSSDDIATQLGRGEDNDWNTNFGAINVACQEAGDELILTAPGG